MDVGIASVPARFRQVHPALQWQIDRRGTLGRQGQLHAQWAILGAALDHHIGRPQRQIDREVAVTIEIRLAAATFLRAPVGA
jgi:hypothetical protein